MVVLVAFVALVIAWRVPVLLSALAKDRGLAVAEMVTLIAAGSALWLELVQSPPLLPGLSRPQRAAMAAASMWTIWVLAYITGMSKVAWLAAYSHATGHGLSSAADQQFAVAVMWAVPALCFPPVIYGMIIAWLRDSADPDEELREAGAATQQQAGLAACRVRPEAGARRQPDRPLARRGLGYSVLAVAAGGCRLSTATFARGCRKLRHRRGLGMVMHQAAE